MEQKSLQNLQADAKRIRLKLVEMHYRAKASHLGTGLSEVDLLAYLFGHRMHKDDRFVLSKGHGASGLYATLDHYGRLPSGMLATYYQDGTKLAAHPAPLALADIPIATGSLGHGLSVATGMALGARMSASGKKIYCLLSDGECNEGSIWEAALFAGHHKLENLTVFVDYNGLQGFGRTSEVLNQEPVLDKWTSFGFATARCNAHDFLSIHDAVESLSGHGKPVCVVAQSVKGKGVSFMEDRLEWHYLNVNDEQFRQAVQELERS